MPTTMLDALYPRRIPADVAPDVILASYVDHPEVTPPCMEQLAQLFPNNPRVTISAHGSIAQVFDVERGAMTASNVPNLVVQARKADIEPCVYATADTWAVVKAYCQQAAITLPSWWIADWDGTADVPAGCVAHQYKSNGSYDTSAVADTWPGVTAPHPPRLHRGNAMEFRVIQDPRSATQYAYGRTWAIGISSAEEAKLWFSDPDCISPGALSFTPDYPDAAHFDQMMRSVVLTENTDGLSTGDALKALLQPPAAG